MQQTYSKWDLLLLDDNSGTPLQNCYFVTLTIAELRQRGHAVKLIRNTLPGNVCDARNLLIDEDDFEDNIFTIRIDDDVVLNPDYFERLLEVIDAGYDIATGVIYPYGRPEFVRELRHIKDIICLHELDAEGNLIRNDDDLGYLYDTHKILPCDQFRSHALYYRGIQKKVRYPTNLHRGFREELFFSFKAIFEGYTIGANTGAICYHLIAPSGGRRDPELGRKDYEDDQTARKWVKRQFSKRGDFLKQHHDKVLKQ